MFLFWCGWKINKTKLLFKFSSLVGVTFWNGRACVQPNQLAWKKPLPRISKYRELFRHQEWSGTICLIFPSRFPSVQLNCRGKEKVPSGSLHYSCLTHILCCFKQKSAEKLRKKKFKSSAGTILPPLTEMTTDVRTASSADPAYCCIMLVQWEDFISLVCGSLIISLQKRGSCR